jgi:hypothetical protein
LSQNFQTIQIENIWKGSKILFQEHIFVLKILEYKDPFLKTIFLSTIKDLQKWCGFIIFKNTILYPFSTRYKFKKNLFPKPVKKLI